MGSTKLNTLLFFISLMFISCKTGNTGSGPINPGKDDMPMTSLKLTITLLIYKQLF